MEEASKVRCLLDPAEALKQNELTKPRVREDPDKGGVCVCVKKKKKKKIWTQDKLNHSTHLYF
jgi:hypothetical protein